jgi:ATP synthase protein I
MSTNHRSANALEQAVRRRAEREAAAQRARIGSIVRNLGLMGLLGWLIVTPPLLSGFLGRWLDRLLGTGIQLTAALLMVGLGVGGWLAWRRIRDAGIFGKGDRP